MSLFCVTRRAIEIYLTCAMQSGQRSNAAGPQKQRTVTDKEQTRDGSRPSARPIGGAPSQVTAFGSHASKGVDYVFQKTCAD